MKRSVTGIVLVVLSAGCGRPAPPPQLPSTAQGSVSASVSGASAVSPPKQIEAVALPAPKPGDWPWWRGPALDGKSTDSTAPISWNQTQNVTWKADVPGRGLSSPIVVGNKVLLTTADEQSQTQSALCFDRASGKPLWSTPIHNGGFLPMHGKNSHASATPACDGERVFCAFINNNALHVTALDLTGKTLWQTNAGPFNSEHGYGSSPVLYGSLVIVNGDSRGSGFIAALHRKSGEVVWRTLRRAIRSTATTPLPSSSITPARTRSFSAGSNA